VNRSWTDNVADDGECQEHGNELAKAASWLKHSDQNTTNMVLIIPAKRIRQVDRPLSCTHANCHEGTFGVVAPIAAPTIIRGIVGTSRPQYV
jgi:hypothetical protein